tara:strand:- start:502 stop:846 length:345 start_codon:yes stop_codon:yes gene_type:complete
MGKTQKSTFPLDLTFFGLTYKTAPQSRVSIFSQIHQIVFHGKGGYDWNTVYNMPIWLRRFTFNEIQKYYDEEKKQVENSNKKGNKTVIDSSGKVKSPQFLSNVSQGTKSPVKYK